MKYKTRLWIAALVLAVMACSCPISGIPGATPEPQVSEPVVQTEQLPVPTEVPVTGTQPIGVGVQTVNGLAFYDLNGNLLNSVIMPDSVMLGQDFMHFAGGFSGGVPPIIYYTYANQGELRVKAPASDYLLSSIDNINALTGAPGSDVFAYSVLDFSGGVENVPSHLYSGSLAAVPTTPVTTVSDPNSWSLRVLTLEMDGNTPLGAWYTLVPWGIGGDIVFEPRKGFYYYNLSNGATTEWLDQQNSPWALSDDRIWMAYSPSGPVGGSSNSMHLRNMQSGQDIEIPLAPTMTESRGAGDAIFSPDALYLAWREGSGWQMAETPDFHSRIRVADMNGNLVVDMSDTILSSLHSEWTHVWPVAWLDAQTLLLQIGWGDTAVLVRLSLVDQTPTYFVPGSFIGFMYP